VLACACFRLSVLVFVFVLKREEGEGECATRSQSGWCLAMFADRTVSLQEHLRSNVSYMVSPNRIKFDYY